MVTGVNEGFAKTLEMQGVGYRAQMQGRDLVLAVGYSHPVEFSLPEGIAAADVDKNSFKLSGIDKEKLGLTAAKIRAIRPPDSYKGKGIRYKNERIKLKPGKSGSKK